MKNQLFGKNRITANDGKNYDVKHYNLDVIKAYMFSTFFKKYEKGTTSF